MGIPKILAVALALYNTAFASNMTFTFPPNQENGVYLAYYDANGVEVHTKLPDAPPTTHTRPTSSLAMRDVQKRVIWPTNTKAWCTTGDSQWVNRDDFYLPHHAWDRFYDKCWELGNNRFTGMLYATYGTVRAFECSYSSNPCQTDEWAAAVEWIRAACPGTDGTNMEPGFLDVKAWRKSYGYGRDGRVTC